MKKRIAVTPLWFLGLILISVGLFLSGCDNKQVPGKAEKEDIVITLKKASGAVIVTDGAGYALEPQPIEGSEFQGMFEEKIQRKEVKAYNCTQTSDCFCCAWGSKMYCNPPGCKF